MIAANFRPNTQGERVQLVLIDRKDALSIHQANFSPSMFMTGGQLIPAHDRSRQR
jgi:hypothetical protein